MARRDVIPLVLVMFTTLLSRQAIQRREHGAGIDRSYDVPDRSSLYFGRQLCLPIRLVFATRGSGS